MAHPELLRLLPGAPQALRDILDGARGPVQPPIRSEIFGLQRFAQHGRSLGETHRAARAGSRAATFFPRLRSNIRALREAHRYIGVQAATGYDISPAAEWLLDNFHLIEAQLKEIHDGLPRSYFRALPVLLDEPLAGLPRVYGVAWAFVAHTDGAFDEDLLVQLPLRLPGDARAEPRRDVGAADHLARGADREPAPPGRARGHQQGGARGGQPVLRSHRDLQPGTRSTSCSPLLEQRGVGRVFLAQMAQRLQDRRTTATSARRAITTGCAARCPTWPRCRRSRAPTRPPTT